MTKTFKNVYHPIKVSIRDSVCSNCEHFYQHYIFDDFCSNKFVPIHAGHCSYPRRKDRAATDTCRHFEHKQ